MEDGVLPDEVEAPPEQRERAVERVLYMELCFPAALQVVVIRLLVLDGPFRDVAILMGCQRELEGLHDGARDSLLNVEEVVQRAAVLVGPQMDIRVRVNQLGRDTEVVACLPDAAFDDMTDSQLATNGLEVLLAVLQLRHGPARDHAQGPNL